jgi:hypothetical protein
VPSQGIILKTREDVVTLGAALPDPEVSYLYSVVARALAGEREEG